MMALVLCCRCEQPAFTLTKDHGPLCQECYRAARPLVRRAAALFKIRPCPACGAPVLIRLDRYSEVGPRCWRCGASMPLCVTEPPASTLTTDTHP
jgi:hypothetical protein